MSSFDPDALLAALPRRAIRPAPSNLVKRQAATRPTPAGSALGQKGEYNGFTLLERNRTAALSNWLASIGCTSRAQLCDICGAPAKDEHAENYYDLTTWVGLCQRCHRTLLHGRFVHDTAWHSRLDAHQKAMAHWSRLVAPKPFDLAVLIRQRGGAEPSRRAFLEPVLSKEHAPA